MSYFSSSFFPLISHHNLEIQAAAKACGIQSMPTFQFYKNQEKIDEFSGADLAKLKACVQKHQSEA